MYTHHQPKHLNTERWRQHWSSCYNQISCWKLLSPGIYINACLMSIIHPNIIADQMNPLMATVLLDGRTIHVQHLRNSSGNGLMNLNWPLNSSDPKSVEHQISWASVGCARAKSHPCRGAPMDRSWLKVHPMDAQLDWDLRKSESRLTLWALCHVPLVAPEQFLQWCSCIVLLGGHCHGGVSGASQRGVQVKAKTQGFPAERGIVTSWSMLFISLVIGFNLVAVGWMYTC